MNLHTDILDTPDIFWDEESIDLTLKCCLCAFLLLTISITHVCIYVYIYYATGTLEKKNSGCAILCITIRCWVLLVKHTCILRFGPLESAGTI